MRSSLLLLFVVGLCSCNTASATPKPALAEDVVAVVNGAPIRDVDVALRARSGEGHKAGREHASDDLSPVLDTVIQEEVVAQRAAELGLDEDPKYVAGLKQLEAQLAAYRRKGLSELYWEREVDKKAEPTEDECRKYFETNGARIRTEVHVKQVLRRSEASIDEVQKKLAAGTKLDDVARSLFPNLAPDQTPWDLGYLDFRKVPDAWREVVYSMKPGDVSGVLRGAGDRYWIVELVDRRENTAMTFEEARPAIAADLKRSRVDEARSQARKSLSEKAHVDRIRAPKAPVVTIPAEH